MPELAWAESTPVAQYLFSLRLGPLRVFPYRVTDTRGPHFSLSVHAPFLVCGAGLSDSPSRTPRAPPSPLRRVRPRSPESPTKPRNLITTNLRDLTSPVHKWVTPLPAKHRVGLGLPFTTSLRRRLGSLSSGPIEVHLGTLGAHGTSGGWLLLDRTGGAVGAPKFLIGAGSPPCNEDREKHCAIHR
jgi:hypothetical protein